MKLLFTQEQPQIHYITLKYENRSKKREISLLYRLALFIITQ